MFGSDTFSFETPNVIDVGDLPPTPPTRSSSLSNETSNGTGTTASLSSSSSSSNATTMIGNAVDVVIDEGTHQNEEGEDSVHFHHLARASATRLLNDIRDLELQSQPFSGPHQQHDQLPLPRSTIYNSDSDPTITTKTTKIPLSQRLPFRDFPSGRRNIKKSPNEMYDPYMDDDEEEQHEEGDKDMKDVMIPYSDHDQHSLPTSGEGLRTNNHHRNQRQKNNHPYHQNRMGRTMKLSAPSKKNLTTHQPALPRSLFHRSNQNNNMNNSEEDIQNLYDPNHPKGNHPRYQYLCALLEEMIYYMKFYRYRILCLLLMAILVMGK